MKRLRHTFLLKPSNISRVCQAFDIRAGSQARLDHRSAVTLSVPFSHGKEPFQVPTL
jgi:hypothetical protein